MANIEAKVLYCNKELTRKDEAKLIYNQTGYKLDDYLDEHDDLNVMPVLWAKVHIHNDALEPDRQEYDQHFVMDKDGAVYVTGSAVFWNSFMDINKFMEGSEEEYGIRIFKAKSKAGNSFITCEIL